MCCDSFWSQLWKEVVTNDILEFGAGHKVIMVISCGPGVNQQKWKIAHSFSTCIQLLEKGLSTCHPPMFCLKDLIRYKNWLMRVDSRHLLGLTMLSVSTVRLNTGNDLLLEIRIVRLTEIQGLDSGRLSGSFFALIIFPCLELWNWMLNDAQESTKVPKLTRICQKPLHFHHQDLIQESDNKSSNNFHLHGHFCSPTSSTDGHEQTSVGLILTSSAAASSHG